MLAELSCAHHRKGYLGRLVADSAAEGESINLAAVNSIKANTLGLMTSAIKCIGETSLLPAHTGSLPLGSACVDTMPSMLSAALEELPV